jgi:Glucodextranase, domain B/Bacterial Ig-like domain
MLNTNGVSNSNDRGVMSSFQMPSACKALDCLCRGISFGAKLFAVLVFVLPALVSSARADGGQNPVVFQAQTFVRAKNGPTNYSATFEVPGWVVAPFNMQIVNGDPNGHERVSSATVSLNSVQVLGPSGLSQSVGTLNVGITPVVGQNTLQVMVDGTPGSEITIIITGTNADQISPQVTIVNPASGSYINTATPRIQITYSKAPGFNDDQHSACDSTTLKITLDGVNRTDLFTIRQGDATATIPSNLALSQGPHTLVATLYNFAGNEGSATSQFTVDLTPPTIQIVQPPLGAYLNVNTPTISIQYSDNDAVNLSTLKVLINGTDRTSLFIKASTGATATLPASDALPQGANQVVAQIQDLAGNQASTSTSFNIDTTAPTISFSQPTANSYLGSSTVQVMVQYSDDQAINTAQLNVTLDGVALQMAASLTSASTTVSGLANGTHILAASIKDMAGNVGSTQITFYVDTTIPTIHVAQPAPNAILNTHTPQILVNYTDLTGVNLATLHVLVNGVDATSLFNVTSVNATAQLTAAFALPDGQNTISAQIANLAGTVGTASSTFLVDTTPPTISFQAPPARTNSNAPTVTIVYSDATSGVDPSTLVVTLDGANISTLVAPGASSATGVLQFTPALADGTHVLTATVSDRAGNQSAPATDAFVLDTTPPIVSFASPLDNSFINNPTPMITLQYSDGTGVGVNTNSVNIYLQQGTNPATDIISYFQIGPQQATGAIPSGATLSDGTYVLSAVVSDLVGNIGNSSATFVVDTVPPTGTIQAPAANGIFNTSAVAVTLLYQDDRSGVDTSKLVLTVDGINESGVLTLGPTQATGTLPTLANGVHTIQLTVFDRAGNSSGVISQTFEIDTTIPTIFASVLPAPNAAGWNNSTVTVTFSCADAVSGVASCPSPIAVTTQGANQVVTGTVTSNSGNTATASAMINLDTTPPTITATTAPPPNAAGIYTSNVTVTFSCTDALSGIAICPPPQTVTTQGANQVISGTATDIAGNTATSSVTLNIQTSPAPTITAAVSPSPNASGWNNSPVTVIFTCSGGSGGIASCTAPVTVSTEGAKQVITGTAVDQSGQTASASATVSLDLTPPTVTPTVSPSPNTAGWNNSNVTVSFQCTDGLSGVASCPPAIPVTSQGVTVVTSQAATDVAGNSTTASILVKLDTTPPTIAITSPAAGSVYESQTTVSGTVSDAVSGVASVSCNGAAAQFSGGTFTCVVTLSTGAGAISATGVDAAGNSAATSVNVTLVPAPVVTITSPANLSFTNLTPVTVSGTVDNSADTVTINGIAAFPSGGTFSAQVPLTEGINTLTALATNAGGNQGTASVNVTLDTMPPHLTIDYPTNQSVTTAASVTVTGTVNDIVVGTVNDQNATVTVNGTAAQVANRSYSLANVPLSLGVNTIQAIAKDEAGNATTTTITVTRVSATQPPAAGIGQSAVTQSLNLISGNNQSGTIATQLSSPLVVSLTDSSGNPVVGQPVVFRITDNDGVLVAGSSSGSSLIINTGSNGQAQVTWTLGHRSGAGINRVEASSALAFNVADFIATGLSGSPALIVVDTGNNQTGIVGQPLTFPFGVVVTDAGYNRVPGVQVTFKAVSTGASFAGATTQVVTTDSDGRALATLSLGTGPSNIATADFSGDPGSPAGFTATAMLAGNPAQTTISGVVLDNSDNPIQNVTIRLYQTNQASNNNQPVQIGSSVQTDVNGEFTIPNAPYGYFKLMADGTTAGGGTVSYPTLEYDIVTVAGQNNTVGTPIYLPVLNPANQICVDATHGGTLTLPQYPGFSLTVAPGSATFPGGARQGCVSVSTVHGDKVPMAPGFGQQPRFIVTIQPVGTLFNPPAAMTLPNVDGLAPNAKTEMYSYDHDLSMFVAIGTATVSADGSMIASDAGTGVLKAGWHCGGDPSAAGTVADCGECQVCAGPGAGCVPVADGTACGTAPQDLSYSLSFPGPSTVNIQLGQGCASGNACQDGACAASPNGNGFNQQQIEAAVEQALTKIFDDSSGACIQDPLLRLSMQNTLTTNGLFIDCLPQPANSPNTCSRDIYVDGSNVNHIVIFPLFSSCSDPPPAIILHEVVHAAGDPGAPDLTYHQANRSYDGPDCRDRPYGCEAACFGLTGSGTGNPLACEESPGQLASNMYGCEPCVVLPLVTYTDSSGVTHTDTNLTVCPTAH